ncbi:MAG: ATP-binding protein [Clostridiales bacterium]|nr:ATP-binding protein [Clostridiales bacterium]
MIRGSIDKIDLGTSFFEDIISRESFYVDKSGFIERFLNNTNKVILIARQRRLGKSLNMDMLRCFLTDQKDNRALFSGLYVEKSPVWPKAHSAPVFYFSFKNMSAKNYKYKLFRQVVTAFNPYFIKNALSENDKSIWDDYLNAKGNDSDGLLLLTELVFNLTGKKSYILIDEYDKLLRDNYQADEYDDVFEYVKLFLSAGLKDNPFIEKGLMAGVLRISYEGMLSDLNNVVTYDVFNDDFFTDDYGFTEEEIDEIMALTHIDKDKLRLWYNGVKINQKAIYNVYSVSSFLQTGKYGCYWGNSRLLDMIVDMMNDDRKNTLMELLNGGQKEVIADTRISLKKLWRVRDDRSFYSFLIQGGYLAMDSMDSQKGTVKISIPNKELIQVWSDSILSAFYPDEIKIKTMFDNADNTNLLSKDIENFLSDSMSYYDLSVHKGEDAKKVWERVYHIFILGILSAYSGASYRKPISEGEGGDGRYDVLYQRDDVNYIFEFKACEEASQMEKQAEMALRQIDIKRYGAGLKADQHVVKVGISLFGKQCKVRCE